MRLFLIFVVVLCCFHLELMAQQPKDYSLCVEVNISESPNLSTTFSWEMDEDSTDYVIRRKLINQKNWDTLQVLPSSSNGFIMNDFEDSTHYDMSIIKNKSDYSSFSYFAFGTNIKLDAFKGSVLLLVDEVVAPSLIKELKRFENDLNGDGFAVIRKEVPRTEHFDTNAVKHIKETIDLVYNTEPTLTTVILFGRIAVPYSGAYAVDGHIPDHLGCWPADVYYAAPEAIWTDEIVNAYSADDERNRNIPGDGRFDETTIDGEVKLQLGRIDFYNLPVFEESEIELLKNYLDKNHAFRYGTITPPKRGLIDDRLKYINPEPFSSGSWYNFYGIFGKENIDTLDYRNSLENSSYLWSYGSNSGSYSSIAHVATAYDYATRETNGVFTSITGSYLPDWDYKDNLLRCAIASSPSMLVSFFDGLPDWHYHNMALGETIGYATMLTQNNRNLFKANDLDGFRQIHIALMGDPTLKMIYPKPPDNFRIIDTIDIDESQKVVLEFEGVAGIDRFNLYARDKNSNVHFLYRVVNSNKITIDIDDLDIYYFMIKSVRYEIANIGTYFNESIGTQLRLNPPVKVVDIFNENQDILCFPNPAKDNITIKLISKPQHLDILDIHGNIIWNIKAKEIFGDSMNWNLVDNAGRRVSKGFYILRLSYPTKVIVAKVHVMY